MAWKLYEGNREVDVEADIKTGVVDSVNSVLLQMLSITWMETPNLENKLTKKSNEGIQKLKLGVGKLFGAISFKAKAGEGN